MTTAQNASEVLSREFLLIRAKLLELAATLDRMDRAEGSVENDHRMQQIRGAMAILADNEPARAERLQLVFSLPYQSDWIESFRGERQQS